jgi:hypothetical protein
MDTWAIQAAVHGSLTSGFNYDPIPVTGTGSMNSVAVGTGLIVLAFAATRVSRQLGPLRPPTLKFSPRKKRPDASPAPVVADQSDESQPTAGQRPGVDEIFWPSKRSADGSTGGYQSKHRLPGPVKPPPRERRAPRHAAPSARSAAR